MSRARASACGDGFGGVVAAETLATNLSYEHQLTLVSRDDRFLFYPVIFLQCHREAQRVVGFL
ncbi:MAG: hypothetical protein ACHBNF_17700 [Chromatiales bacterium]